MAVVVYSSGVNNLDDANDQASTTTFSSFCLRHEASEEERIALREYLAFLRMRKTMEISLW